MVCKSLPNFNHLGYTHIFNYLIKNPTIDLVYGVYPTKIDGTRVHHSVSLCLACFHERVDIVKFLLKIPEIHSTDDQFPLFAACKNGNLEIVQLLLNDIQDPSSTALDLAISYGHLNVVKT